METAEEVLTIAAAEWAEADAVALASAFTVSGALEAVAAQVQSGAACLFHVIDGAAVVGRYVLRVDQLGDSAEGVVVCAWGEWRGGALLPVVLPYIEKQFRGVSALRIHSARPGMIRRLAAIGYQPQEIVMRKEIGA